MCHAYQQSYISPRLGESGIREIFASGLWSPKKWCLWNPEYSSRNPHSHQRLVSGSQVPLTKNPESRIQVSWIPLHIILVKLRNNKQKKFKNKIRSVINEQKIIIRCWSLTINNNSRNTESVFECSVESIHQKSCNLGFRSLLLNFGQNQNVGLNTSTTDDYMSKIN